MESIGFDIPSKEYVNQKHTTKRKEVGFMMNGTMVLVKVTELVVDNETFIIARDGHGYFWAFNKKDIDKSGHLTRVYNGLEGKRYEKMEDTMMQVYISVKANYLDWDKIGNGDAEEIEKTWKIVNEAKALFHGR